MHLNIKPYLIILASVILAFAVFAFLRHFGLGLQIAEWGKKNQATMKVIVISAFMLFAAAAVPVFLKIFIAMQIRIGNGEAPLVKLLSQHAMKLIYTAWIMFALGLGIALPVMIRHGLLSNGN